MMRWCVYCEPAHFLGEIAPLKQKDRTDGMCREAAIREDRKLDELLGAEHMTDFEISSASPIGDSVTSWRPGPSSGPFAAPAASRDGDASPDKAAAEGRDPHRLNAATDDQAEHGVTPHQPAGEKPRASGPGNRGRAAVLQLNKTQGDY